MGGNYVTMEKIVSQTPAISAVVLVRDEDNDLFRACLSKLLKFCNEVVVVVDTRTVDGTIHMLDSLGDDRIRIFSYDWKGKPESYTDAQNYGISKCKGEWILHIDADEIVTDRYDVVLNAIKSNSDCDCFSLVSEHFVYHLGFRDATHNPHVHMSRLHKNKSKIKYPKSRMHGLVEGFKKEMIIGVEIVNGEKVYIPIIWHCGYIKNILGIMKRYNENMERLEIHTPESLKWWKNAHLFGTYPVQILDVNKIPSELKEFCKLE